MTGMSTFERELLFDLAASLRERLPETWRIAADEWEALNPSLSIGWRTPDGLLVIIPPNARSIRLAVEVKTSLTTPKDAYLLASGLTNQFKAISSRTGAVDKVDGVLLLTYFLSPRARELLVETDVSYADSMGNIRIAVDDPPLFIQMSGLDRLPTPQADRSSFQLRSPTLWDPADRQRLLRSFKGPGAALGIRALVDFRPPYGLRDLAERARVSIGTLSRVLKFAEGEALIEREPRGPIVDVDWEQFLRRWAMDYSLLQSNRTRVFLEPRGVEALLPRLRNYVGRYAVSGSLAAHTVAPEAPVALAVIYVTSFEAAQDLDLRGTDSGGNVMLVQPFPAAKSPESTAQFLRTRSIDGLEYVALSQTVVDLLTSPGRGPAEAEALLSWMKANEDAWRTT